MKINNGVKRDLWIMSKANKDTYGKVLGVLEKRKGSKKGYTLWVSCNGEQFNIYCENYKARKML